MPTKRDYYEILGISKTATPAEVKAAYKKMALKWHPDRNPDSKKAAEEKFKEINEAYQVISDEQKRKTYDQFGHAAFDASSGMGGRPPGGGFGQGPFTWSYTSTGGPQGDFDFGDPFEIFEQFFGGGGGFGRQQARRARYSLTIDFMDAIKGAEKEVDVSGKKQKIKIPAGADNGTRIRFDDFDITINVAPDSKFKRDGQDLFVEQIISFTTAALGGEIQVPKIDGSLKLKVRAGTQSHTLVRLRGEGVPHLQRGGKGDLYVRLIVQVPEKLTRQQKKLLEEFAEVS